MKKLTFSDIVPEGLSLFPYQRNGVKWLLKRKRSLLASEMGLGKTPQAIVCANAWGTQQIVVVCPAVMRCTWQSEWELWSTQRHKVLQIVNSKTIVPNDINVLVISYDLTIRSLWKEYIISFLKKSDNSLLICDESAAIKSWRANRTRTIIKDIIPHATRVLLLNGTPMTNTVADLHSQFSAVDPGNWGKFGAFCERYSYPQPTPYGSGVEYRGLRNVKELKERASKIMLRHFKDEVLKDLPAKQYCNVLLEVELGSAYNKDEDRLIKVQEILKAIEEGRDVAIPGTLAEERKLLGIQKLEPGCEWFDTFLESHVNSSGELKPLVVFAHHRAVIDKLITYFDEKGISVCSITGDTPNGRRGQYIKDFQNGKYKVFVLSMMAAGVGITLTAADTCVFFELDYTPAVLSQCADRLHRVGQKNNVKIYFIIAKESLDSELITVIKRKMRETEKILGNKSNT